MVGNINDAAETVKAVRVMEAVVVANDKKRVGDVGQLLDKVIEEQDRLRHEPVLVVEEVPANYNDTVGNAVFRLQERVQPLKDLGVFGVSVHDPDMDVSEVIDHGYFSRTTSEAFCKGALS